MTDDLRRTGPLVPLPREVLERHALDAAAGLLGALVVRVTPRGRVVARIVETEAYREDDPASHSHAKRTARSEPMFWRAGTAYVYRSYGVHWCLNVVVEAEDVGAAVLLRAAVPVTGIDQVRSRRAHVRRDRDLLRGPGNLTAGLAVDGTRHDRTDLLEPEADLHLATDGWAPELTDVTAGPRVGVRLAADRPWRLWCAGVPEVSRYTRSPRAEPAPDRGPAA